MKKRKLYIIIIIIIIILLIITMGSLILTKKTTSNKTKTNIKDIEVQIIGDFNNGLAPFKANDKYGFIDKKGNIVIEPTYTLARNFKDGLALVCKQENECGYINNKNKAIIDYKYDINLYNKEDENKIFDSKVKDGLLIVDKESKKALFNTKGKQLTKFKYIKEIHLSKDGIITTSNDSFTYKLVNVKKGSKTIIEEPFIDVGFCANNLCVIGKQLNKNLSDPFTYGYIDYNGKTIIDCKYTRASYFNKDGIAIVENNKKVGLINKKGEYVVDPIYYYWDASYAFYNTDSIEEGFILSKDDYKTITGFDSFGKKLFEIQTDYRISSNFSNGYAMLYKDNTAKRIQEKYYINKKGEIKFGPYEICRAFSDGLAFIKEEDNFYFINKNGEKVIEGKFKKSKND